eukprot:gnl/Spiro4/12957_TR6863_c0_g1_i1.p2 gnl/Spiro4/12957_TR6863_c0_g1~~gnl/Spiro4/12957_TR6863_c0_g1_i1.p2  ORF type:complete len:179 (-),score=58.93 gnl/Spiro4/12957_TR6863_c0_g1_i1:151-687(-)
MSVQDDEHLCYPNGWTSETLRRPALIESSGPDIATQSGVTYATTSAQRRGAMFVALLVICYQSYVLHANSATAATATDAVAPAAAPIGGSGVMGTTGAPSAPPLTPQPSAPPTPRTAPEPVPRAAAGDADELPPQYPDTHLHRRVPNADAQDLYQPVPPPNAAAAPHAAQHRRAYGGY